MTSFELNGMRPLCFIGAGADAAPGVLWCLMKALALYHRIAIQISTGGSTSATTPPPDARAMGGWWQWNVACVQCRH